MSRPAIVFFLLVAIASIVLGTYYVIFPRVADVQRREQMTSLALSGRLLQEMDSADETRLTRTMMEFTQRPSLRAVLQEKPSDAGRETWLGRLRNEAVGMAATVRALAPLQDFFILDPGGVGLARANDPQWTGKPPSDNARVLELVQQAQAGTPQATLAVSSKNLFRAIAVPLLSNDAVIGIVLALFPLDERVATMRSGELGLGFYFAYLGNDGIYASTLDATALGALKAFIQERPDVVRRLLSGERVEPWIVESGSRTLQALGVPVTGSGGRGQVTVAVFRELLEADRPFGTFGVWLFASAGLVLMVLVTAVALFGGRLARGVKLLEHDARTIAGGAREHSFTSLGPAPIRSLAKLLNTIRSEAKAEEVDFQSPQTHDLGEDGAQDSGPEDEQTTYVRELFKEFVRAKKKVGEETQRLDFKRFHAKLNKQKEALKAKHGCQAVRFEVTITDNQVKLRPRFIRDATK